MNFMLKPCLLKNQQYFIIFYLIGLGFVGGFTVDALPHDFQYPMLKQQLRLKGKHVASRSSADSM
jgi:hypothetical protein